MSCNDPNVTEVCDCAEKEYELERWDENLVSEFDLHCEKRSYLAWPDLFYNIGVVLACVLGVLVDGYKVCYILHFFS